MRAVRQRAEKKYRDAAYNQTITTAGFLTSPLSLIVQGTDQSNRIGQKIFLRYIKIRFELFSNNEDLMFWRIAVCRGRTTGIGLPDFPVGTTGNVLFLDIEKVEVLWETTINLGDTDTDGKNKRFINKTIRVMKPITFNGTDILPIVNPIYLYLWNSDIVPTVANHVGLFRMYFNDI